MIPELAYKWNQKPTTQVTPKNNESLVNEPDTPQPTGKFNGPDKGLNAIAIAQAINTFVHAPNSAAYLNKKANLFTILHDGQASEIRYSNFLSWLLDPQENHGLGSFFADALVTQLNADGLLRFEPPTPPYANTPDDHPEPASSQTEALGQSIDIVYRNDSQNLGIVVENKTGSELHLANYGEETRKAVAGQNQVVQLQKYYEVLRPAPDSQERVSARFLAEAKALRRMPLVFIFLTPYGESVEESLDKADLSQYAAPGEPWFDAWIPVSYAYLAPLLNICISKLYEVENSTSASDAEKSEATHARIAIQDFYWDQHRRFDDKLTERVQQVLNIGDPRAALGGLGSELVAGLLALDLKVDAAEAGGAYQSTYDQLSATDMSKFRSELVTNLGDVTERDAEIVLRDIFWAHKPRVNTVDTSSNPEVQNLVAKLVPELRKRGYTVEASGGGQHGGQALHMDLSAPCTRHANTGNKNAAGWMLTARPANLNSPTTGG